MTPRIGFIGVGAMGAGMVSNLRRKRFAVTFYTRDTERGREAAARLTAEGARRTPDLSLLGRESDLLILCLPDSPTVESILDNTARLVPNLAPGTIIVDCSTSHPDSTRRLAERLLTRNITLLDGPLTGSRAQAESGTLSVLGAGPHEAFERAKPVLSGFASKVFHLGASGAGHTAKLINNYLGQLALIGLCEAWPLIAAYGINPDVLFDAITASGGNSAAFQGAYPKLRQRDFALLFAQKLAGKDVRYLNELERAIGAAAPMAERLQEVHDKATAAGYGDRDVKALLLYLEQVSGKAGARPD